MIRQAHDDLLSFQTQDLSRHLGFPNPFEQDLVGDHLEVNEQRTLPQQVSVVAIVVFGGQSSL